MFEDIKTLIWFIKRPKFYATMIFLVLRKFLPNKDTLENRQQNWCQERTVSIEECYERLGLDFFDQPLHQNEHLFFLE